MDQSLDTVRKTGARCLLHRRAYERITKTPKRIAKRKAELESEGYQVHHSIRAPRSTPASVLQCHQRVSAATRRTSALHVCRKAS